MKSLKYNRGFSSPIFTSETKRMPSLQSSDILCKYPGKMSLHSSQNRKEEAWHLLNMIFQFYFKTTDSLVFKTWPHHSFNILCYNIRISVSSYSDLIQSSKQSTWHPHKYTTHWLIWIPFSLLNFIKHSSWQEWCSCPNYAYFAVFKWKEMVSHWY